MYKFIYFLILNTLLFAEGFGIPMYQTQSISSQEIHNLQKQKSIEALEREKILEQLINKKISIRIQHSKTQENIIKIKRAQQTISPDDIVGKNTLKELLDETEKLETKQQTTINKINKDIKKLQKRSF